MRAHPAYARQSAHASDVALHYGFCGDRAGGVRNAALQLQRAREAVASSQVALEGEREKYRLGVGQLVDVLTMEDRLTTAEPKPGDRELGYALH